MMFGKKFNLYINANKHYPLPIISIAICDDSYAGSIYEGNYAGVLIIRVAILGVEAGVQYIG